MRGFLLLGLMLSSQVQTELHGDRLLALLVVVGRVGQDFVELVFEFWKQFEESRQVRHQGAAVVTGRISHRHGIERNP